MTTPVDITDDLDAFSDEFFETKPQAEDEVSEDTADDEDELDDDGDNLGEDDNPPAPEDEDEDEEAEESNDSDEDEDEDDDGEDEEEEEPEEDPKPKPRKKSVQERINELTAKTREAERREAELIRRLEAAEAAVKKEAQEEAPELRDVLPSGAPDPDAKDEKGESLYPLGEFDPLYIRDITKFTIAQEMEAAKEKAEQEAREREVLEAQEQLKEQWVEKIETAEKDLPDLREKMADLADAFGDVDPTYGDYLAATIMSSDLGPQIMYYLADNIGEAQQIVASGPAAATLALGRLEARLQTPPVKSNKRKRSEAPAPPESRSRGHGGKFTTPHDTEDLDAFEKVYFQ